MSTGNVNGRSTRVCVRIPHDLVAALDKVSDNRSEAVIAILAVGVDALRTASDAEIDALMAMGRASRVSK